MSPFFALFSVFEWLEIVAVALVFLGVAGEVIASRRNPPNKRAEHFWEAVLIIGLALELAFIPITLRETARLKRDTEELRKQNLLLEAQIQPRRITKEQEAQITKHLEKWRSLQKCSVALTVQATDGEAILFMKQIANVLRKCGFVVNEFPMLTLPQIGGPTPPPPPVVGLHFLMTAPPPPGADDILTAFQNAKMQPNAVEMGGKRSRNGILDIEVGFKALPP